MRHERDAPGEPSGRSREEDPAGPQRRYGAAAQQWVPKLSQASGFRELHVICVSLRRRAARDVQGIATRAAAAVSSKACFQNQASRRPAQPV